jgi:septum formation protein
MAAGTLLLASGSPRRRDLLRWLGVPFSIQVPCIDELPAAAGAHLTPRELAWANTQRKGMAISRAHPEAWVLSADTIVVLGHTIYGKPGDLAEAAIFLRQLAGKTHEVLTAVGLFHAERTMKRDLVATQVSMHHLSDRQIDEYLHRVPVLDKAGAYAVQERGDDLICKLEGSLSNVMGLPLETVSKMLAAHGMIRAKPSKK